MHNIILISIMILSFVCSPEKQETEKKINKDSVKKDIVSYNIDLKDNQTVIPASQKMDWAFGKNYKQYEPSQNDIEEAEKLLKVCF